jgi:hypothetical protein
MSWTKQAAKKELEALIRETQVVAEHGNASPEFIRWYLRAATFLDEVFGGSSKLVMVFRSLKFQASGSFFPQTWDIQGALDKRHYVAFLDDLNRAIGIFQAALDELLRKSLSEVYHGKNTPKESSTLIRIISLADRRLRKTIRNVPQKEKDVQDAFEVLLIGADIPYRREHPHIAYSSKEYVPDFSFERIDLALDVKLCARDSREKKIIAEINDDIMAYKTKFGNVAFVIYDIGMIRDVDRFTSEFGTKDDVLITVVKH